MPRPLVQSDFRKRAGDLVRGPDVAGRPGREAVDDGRRMLSAALGYVRMTADPKVIRSRSLVFRT